MVRIRTPSKEEANMKKRIFALLVVLARTGAIESIFLLRTGGANMGGSAFSVSWRTIIMRKGIISDSLIGPSNQATKGNAQSAGSCFAISVLAPAIMCLTVYLHLGPVVALYIPQYAGGGRKRGRYIRTCLHKRLQRNRDKSKRNHPIDS